MRKQRNIAITGTPGVDKSTHAEALAAATGLTHLSINAYATEHGCIVGKDAALASAIVDEDLLLEALEGTG